jgi:hypothetical protein
MLSLLIEDEELSLKNLDKVQLEKITQWFQNSDPEQYKYAMGIDKPIMYQELYEKYLEALINAHEFFLSIIFKG